MAAYIPVPRDLTRVKTKVFLNLTKRQLICFRTGGTHRCAVFLFDQECRLNEPCGHEHDHHHDPHVPLGNVRA